MKAIIDLDWLDAQIESETNKMKRSTHELHVRGFERSRNKLKLVRSKCEPIATLHNRYTRFCIKRFSCTR
jgi:hypothetical protein